MLEMFDTRDWIENFQMKRETFNYICDKLRPSIVQQDQYINLVKQLLNNSQLLMQVHLVICTVWCKYS